MIGTRMRDDYDTSGFFVARVPLLPADAFLGGDVEGRAALRDRLRTLLDRPDVAEALFLASPGLHERLATWREDPESGRARGIECALTRYVARMSLRCTPFGLFAGVTPGLVGQATDLRLAPASSIRRHTRLDMGYLATLLATFAARPSARTASTYETNSSLYRAGGRLRYFEARPQGTSVSYFLVALDEDDVLRAALDRARDGVRRDTLADAIAREAGVDQDEALAYVDELIDAQVLVLSLAPAVTGPDALDDVLAQLTDLPSSGALREALRLTREHLRAMDESGAGVSPARYRDLIDHLLQWKEDADRGRLVQVDSTRPTLAMSLDARVAKDVLDAIEVLHDLFGDEADDGLGTFRTAFRERYGDREVPLLEVLDEESGIGYRRSSAPAAEALPLLAGIQLDGTRPANTAPGGPVRSFLHWKLSETIARGDDTIELTDEDLRRFRQDDARRMPPPDAFAAVISVWPTDDGHRIALHGAGGPSGARMLGRFCHTDPALEESIRHHLRQEEAARPDVVFAEIVHLSEGRMGNILARPVLRDYEITFLGRSGAPLERQIPAHELTVSLRGQHIRLYSHRLGKEVVPRLTSAHNPARKTTRVYQFLADLQRQGIQSSLGWHWGAASDTPFLPAVRYKHVVLSPRRWTVVGRELEPLRELEGDAFAEAFARWADARKLPRFFGLADADNVLPVDRENPLSVDSFWDLVKRRRSFLLDELLPPVDRLSMTGPEGPFTHEMVIPFARVRPRAAAAPVGPRAGTAAEVLRFPGSDWLYASLYAGTAAADRILTGVVAPLRARALREGWARGWFFLRYSDPDFHLRLRIQGEPDALLQRGLPELTRALRPAQEEGLIWRVALGTYEREVHRYGGPEAMAHCEQIFCADSEACLDLLEVCAGDDGAGQRWRATLVGLDRLAADFGLDPLARFQMFERLGASFRAEFGLEGKNKRQVLDRYRRERAGIEAALASRWPVFDARSQRIRPAVAALREMRGRLSVPLEEIVGSLLHMHANRMSRSAARAQEAVLYTLLACHHDSMLARQGIKGAARVRALQGRA